MMELLLCNTMQRTAQEKGEEKFKPEYAIRDGRKEKEVKCTEDGRKG